MVPTLVLAVLLPAGPLPVPPVPVGCIARNRTGEQCCYTCLETLARWHQIRRLSHLTDEYPSIAYPNLVQSILVARSINFRVQQPGNLDPAILRDAVRDHNGAAVCLKVEPPTGYNHMVVLAALASGRATIINDGRYEDMTEAELFRRWTGWAVVLYSDSPRAIMPTHPIQGIPWSRPLPLPDRLPRGRHEVRTRNHVGSHPLLAGRDEGNYCPLRELPPGLAVDV